MKRENVVVRLEEMEVVDGKVVISSEELAAAIQSQIVDLDAEEDAGFEIILFGSCFNKGGN